MFESIKRQPRRRVVKAGIAAAAVVAVAGGFFASQAGAANVRDVVGQTNLKNVMVKTAPGVNCFTLEWNQGGSPKWGKFDLTNNGWRPGWNSTGVRIPVGRHVEALTSTNHCSTWVSPHHFTKKIKVRSYSGDYGDAWLDTTS